MAGTWDFAKQGEGAEAATVSASGDTRPPRTKTEELNCSNTDRNRFRRCNDGTSLRIDPLHCGVAGRKCNSLLNSNWPSLESTERSATPHWFVIDEPPNGNAVNWQERRSDTVSRAEFIYSLSARLEKIVIHDDETAS